MDTLFGFVKPVIGPLIGGLLGGAGTVVLSTILFAKTQPAVNIDFDKRIASIEQELKDFREVKSDLKAIRQQVKGVDEKLDLVIRYTSK